MQKVFWWILAPDTPSDRKNQVIEFCSSLVQTESRATMIKSKAVMMELT
jgi:hypothetical protein